jgi:hypothetical protein
MRFLQQFQISLGAEWPQKCMLGLYLAKFDPIRVWQFFFPRNYHLCFLPIFRKKSPSRGVGAPFGALIQRVCALMRPVLFSTGLHKIALYQQNCEVTWKQMPTANTLSKTCTSQST